MRSSATPRATFPPIVVISLRRSVERRRRIVDRFARLGLEFTFFDAVDGEALDPEHRGLLDASGMLRELGRPMVPGEVGCALSHALLYRHFLENGMEEMVILEDDVIPSPAFAGLLDRLRGTGEDLILLYHDSTRLRPGWRARSRRLGAHHLVSPALSPNCTAAYWLRPRAAEVLLDAALPVRYVSDWPTPVEKTLKAKAVLPRVIERDGSVPSTIGPRPPVLTARKRRLPNLLRRWSSIEVVPR